MAKIFAKIEKYIEKMGTKQRKLRDAHTSIIGRKI